MESGIDASPWVAFLGLTLLYLVTVISLSSLKLLWLDELITLHIARLGSVAAIWGALAQGADPNPPLTHVLVHLCRRIFGEHELALRLPAIAGYWMGMASLFLYLRRRLSATWALAGTVLSMGMVAFDYSFESRSYAIFYGFAMLAFLCWSRAVDAASTRSRRRVALIGMVLALAGGLSSNYFAVLAFLPIAAGELTRTLERMSETRRHDTLLGIASGNGLLQCLDLKIWVGLAAAASPLLVFRSMIAHSIAEFAPYAWNKVSLGQVSDSYTQMIDLILYPILGVLALAVLADALARYWAGFRGGMRAERWGAFTKQVRLSQRSLPLYEAVGVFFLMVYPMLGYAVASIRGGMLSPRFVIPVCFGFAIAGVFAAYRLFGHLQCAGVVLLGCLVVWFCVRESAVGYGYEDQRECFYRVLGHLREAEPAGDGTAAIAIPDPLMALTFEHYAAPAVRGRVVFPIDFPALRHYRRDDSAERNLWAGRDSLYTLAVMPLASFQDKAGEYIILASDDNWMVNDLRDHGYAVERLPIDPRAGGLGGFTPLSHGMPAFFRASGEASVTRNTSPLPRRFQVADNLPEATERSANTPSPATPIVVPMVNAVTVR